ncbi:MAG: hypothetical protein K6G61_07735 [Solobacterium sp.]|nr:hypothetical protein [Solobacterium sp.]
MKQITLHPEPFPKDRLQEKLDEYGIQTNRYAGVFFSHPGFVTEQTQPVTVMIASLRETGLENGASLPEISAHISGMCLEPCPAETGLFLRFAWKDQPASASSVLSGTHEAPDGAVTVFSEPLEEGDDFPKGLYLRNVGGDLWLRGYVCGDDYRFPSDALFAFACVQSCPDDR